MRYAQPTLARLAGGPGESYHTVLVCRSTTDMQQYGAGDTLVGEGALVLRTAHTAPVWRGGTHCFYMR